MTARPSPTPFTCVCKLSIMPIPLSAFCFCMRFFFWWVYVSFVSRRKVEVVRRSYVALLFVFFCVLFFFLPLRLFCRWVYISFVSRRKMEVVRRGYVTGECTLVLSRQSIYNIFSSALKTWHLHLRPHLLQAKWESRPFLCSVRSFLWIAPISWLRVFACTQCVRGNRQSLYSQLLKFAVNCSDLLSAEWWLCVTGNKRSQAISAFYQLLEFAMSCSDLLFACLVCFCLW
jgi:hypothetical protein